MARKKKALSVFISGAGGRMGRTLIRLMTQRPDLYKIVGGMVRKGSLHAGRDLGELAHSIPLGVNALPISSKFWPQAFEEADIAIDFSRPEMTRAMVHAARRYKTPLLIGTTGLDYALLKLINYTAERTPVLVAPNTSLGIALLAQIIEAIAHKLGKGWDIEMLELHHRNKIDAPSGTALMLGEAAARGRGTNFYRVANYNRASEPKLREEGSIGYSVLRGGDVAGEHSVLFLRDGERLEFTHKVSNRDIFAQGALDLVPWLVGRKPGLYDIHDYLGRLLPKGSKAGNR